MFLWCLVIFCVWNGVKGIATSEHSDRFDDVLVSGTFQIITQSGKGVENMLVVDLNSRDRVGKLTDSNGTVVLSLLGDAQFELKATKEGYLDMYIGIRSSIFKPSIYLKIYLFLAYSIYHANYVFSWFQLG